MSSLLLHWLNEDLKVHRKVEVLERDLSNGYVLAEVLHLKGLEPQFENYEDASSTAAKIHNMELLGPRFEALGLPFPVNTRREIMMENRSVVLQFLLQLKDFLRPRPKARPSSGKAKEDIPEQPTKVATAAQSNLPPRDVEERFIVATTKKFHPTEVRFDKGIDMAVHLREFEQARWTAENQLTDIHEQAKADKNSNSAAGYAAARAHLHAKAKFMQDWDKEHFKKWKHTQRIYLAAERDDLRLELALQERQRIFTEAKIAESQQDAAVGVVEFEKNMNRLGLSTGVTAQSLRAITTNDAGALAANDAGALAHLRGLERRVEDLDFRPSNNIKMMKELRKRRKAQLAAEKDRRMRRQKALADQKKSIEAHEAEQMQNHNLHDNPLSFSHETDESPVLDGTTETDLTVDAREKNLEERQAGLEEHYTRLHESGSMKREEDAKILEELRSASRKKEQLRAWAVCSDAVEGLISLATAIVFSSDRDTLDVESLKKLFLQPTSSQPTLNEQGGLELCYGLNAAVSNFLSFSDVWATLPLQSTLTTYDPRSDVQLLAESCSHSTTVLDTSWHRPDSFVILSVFTEDESGVELVRQVSKDHHLVFIQLDHIVEECVKMSYDPQKIGDQLATLSDREQELGAFGLKISSLRQKNTALPETMTTEIIAKAISVYRREAATPPEGGSSVCSSVSGGCILQNFPRTLEEAKLLEKYILADIQTEEINPNEQSTQEEASESQEEPPAPAVISAWDCVLSISADESSSGQTLDAERPLQSSDSTSDLVENRPSSQKAMLAETQKKFASEEEQRARNDEQRLNLENYWSETTRHIRVSRAGLHRDVVLETVHLCIDIFTQSPHKGVPAVIVCKEGDFPEQFKEARDRRRESMGFIDRVMWMRASKELSIADDTLLELVRVLHDMDKSLSHRIREPMARIRSVIQAISTLALTAEQDLDNELQSGGAASFQFLMDQAAAKFKFPSSQGQRERILTELEVSLGDTADFNRVAGNDFVDVLAKDPLPEVIGAVDVVYQCLPPICFFLVDHTMKKLEALRAKMYNYIPFLGEDFQDAGHKVVLSKVVAREAMSAATELGGDRAGGGEYAQLAGEEVLNVLGHIASEYAFHLADDPPAQQYALSETNVTTQEITRLLQQITLLCRFADRLRQTTGQLYANDVRHLEQTVQEDIRSKDDSIEKVMADIRSHGHATWPVRELLLEPVSEVAARLPRTQRENFLSIEQLGALVRACRNWELADPIAAEVFGGTGIASDTFVALVLEVATQESLPARWEDAGAVAAVTLQQCSIREAVSWRKFVWTLLCVEFAGMPSLEDILDYLDETRSLPAIKRQLQDNRQSAHHNIVLVAKDFKKLPLWFEKRREVRTSHNADKLRSLVFQLFATETDTDDSQTATLEHVELLPMLLHWCVHPSCSFSVRHELEEFLPHYPRGLFRAFQLLLKHSVTTSATSCISTLLSITNTSLSTQPLADLLSVTSFPGFSSLCPPSIPHFFLLQNPLQALTHP